MCQLLTEKDKTDLDGNWDQNMDCGNEDAEREGIHAEHLSYVIDSSQAALRDRGAN